MIILLFIVNALARITEEVEEYQIGLMITHPEEDFILIQDVLDYKDYEHNTIKIYDKIGLIKQKNHRMDSIIDMKQNVFEFQYQIWILYRIDNKSILSQQTIFDEQTIENYYLNLHFECYTFYFITKSQIVIDCQNQVCNFLVLFDIQNQKQQSFYHSKFKQVRLRKLLQIFQSDKFLFIQQEEFIILFQQSNKYQVCKSQTFENDAHTGYIHFNIITLISNFSIQQFKLYDNDLDQILDEEFANDYFLENKYPIKFNFQIKKTISRYLIVYSDKMLVCEEYCITFKFNSYPMKVEIKQDYLIIQTQQTIEILSMCDYHMTTIKRQFDNEFVIINSWLKEFYIANKYQLIYYGLSQTSYLRVNKSANIIHNHNFASYFQFQSYDDNISILVDPNFMFKTYPLQYKQKSFVLVGGLLNITFSVENKYKNLITINVNYFLKNYYPNVQFFFLMYQLQKPILLIIQDKQLQMIDLMITDQNKSTLIQIVDHFNFLEKIYCFNQAYYMKDIRNGQQYLITFNETKLDLVKFGCKKSFTLFQCNIMQCICLKEDEIEIYEYQINYSVSLQKNQNERFLQYDKYNKVLYMSNYTFLILYYYENLQAAPIHTQLINLCINFINLVVLKYKLVLVCQEQMILYNKISNFRYVISGNVELYGQTFTQSALVIQNDYNLLYIIDNVTMHVFNCNLPLTQLYVTKMKIEQFDDVKSQNQHICFQLQQNLTCYNYQINIKFNYDDDLVEYHQVFKVVVCGENKYNKKCKQYITRLDQQNRKISVKKPTQQLVIKKDTQEIILDSKYFSGSIEKLEVNNKLIKPKQQIQAELQFKTIFAKQTYFSILDSSIYILNNDSLLIYNIKTRQSQRLTTFKPMKQILKYENNSFILIASNSISLLNCDNGCKEIVNVVSKFILQGILYLHNNSLYTTAYTQLRIYNIENMIHNIQQQPIRENLDIQLIDILEDSNQQICMIYLDFNSRLFFRFQGQTIKYNIQEFFQQQGVGLGQYQYDAIYKIQLLHNCQILFINAQFGAYFIGLYQELKLMAEIVAVNSSIHQIYRVLEGKNYLFYIQSLEDSIIIFQFTYHQIYQSRYIDFYQKLSKTKQHGLQDYYIYTYNDDLFMVQSEDQEKIIYKIILDLVIHLEPINQKEDILVTLTNLDKTKSFILAITFDESYYYLIYWIFVALSLILFITLKYYQIREFR